MSFTKLFNANVRAIGMNPGLAWNIVIGSAVVGLVVVLIGIVTATTVPAPQKEGWDSDSAKVIGGGDEPFANNRA
jgi:hypothetical protein